MTHEAGQRTGLHPKSVAVEATDLRLAGKCLPGDQREGVGLIQNSEAEDSELVDDELEELPEGRENRAIEMDDGVASSLGDFSM